MSKNVLIVSASPRKGGNSDILAEQFAEGAAKAGHAVEKVNLADRQIQFCKGCLVCQNTHQCVIHDDMKNILDQMVCADIVVFATPIYFYEMEGQLKTFLDRTNPLYGVNYSFRDIYLIGSSAEEESSAMDGAVKGLEGWIACFDKTRMAGVVHGGGVTDRGDIKGHSVCMKQAYEMGINV